MATKSNEVDFATMSIDELANWKKQQEDLFAKFQEAESKKIAESKKEAFDELEKVVSKYRLGATDILNSLLKARKIDFAEIKDVKPVYLIKAVVDKQKRNAEEGVTEKGDFLFYEGKVILADKKQAEQVCANGVEEFKKAITEDGKQYLEDDTTKHIVMDFYNTHKPEKASEWK